MSYCFVMQPFDDGGPFDRRFDETLVPAINSADLEAYRVDRDPAATIPIQEIESKIRGASVCVADISTDSPNVWYELGFAIAAQKPVVLICDKQRRERFPFDIQHRTVVRYETSSPADFERLAQQVTERIRAELKKRNRLQNVPLAAERGLQPHEIATLAALMTYSVEGGASFYQLKNDVSAAGFTELAASLAIRRLTAIGYATSVRIEDDHDIYNGYRTTPEGEEWLQSNVELLNLKTQARSDTFGPDDDLPF